MPYQTSEFLRNLPLFGSLSDEAIQQLSSQLLTHSFAQNEQIIQRGQAGDCMYLLVEGQVRILLDERQVNGHSIIHLGAGQIFGEMALLTGAPRSADVIAVQPCLCYSFPKPAIESLMRQFPEVARMLTAILGERLIRSGKLPRIGKYTMLGEIARGGMAVVYEGFHPDLERPVAIKMLHHELVYHPQFGPRFREEARIIAHLKHPHIVEVFDTEEAYATLFIIMEKLKGLDLKSTILARGKIPPSETRSILRQMASALHFAHNFGVIHRDIKPSNVMLSPQGEVKLMDFGIARIQSPHTPISEPDTALGTPFYMAPEQHLGQPIDGRADIYALGVLGYAMLTGSVPFRGDTQDIYEQKQKLGSLAVPPPQSIPEDLALFLQRATAFRIEDRFASAKEILNLLDPPHSRGYEVDEFHTNTLTFVYPHTQKDAVQQLIRACKQDALEIPDLLIVP